MEKINFLILTNNKLVRDRFPQTQFFDEPLLNIFIRARDMIHRGYKLINHPLSGSVKPNQNPYRSFLLEPGDSLDLTSLNAIENGIQSVKKFLKDHPHPDWEEDVLEDFRYIDYSLIMCAFK